MNDKKQIKEKSQIFFENDEEIIRKINENIKNNAERIILFISAKIGLYYFANGTPEHLEWEYDGCPYDNSGELNKKGLINTSESVSEFLEEYNGEWTPTYESGRGKSWSTFDDFFSYDTRAIGETLINEVLLSYAKKYELLDEYNENVTDGIFCWSIYDEIHDHFYDNTLVNMFFYVEGALEACGFSLNMHVDDFIKLGKPYQTVIKKKEEEIKLLKKMNDWDEFEWFRKMPIILKG